jgi:hypothetical protein
MWRRAWSVVSGPRAVLAGAVFAVPAAAWGDGAPRLSLPLECEPGRTCFVQSYVDVKPGPDVRDFACGSATYDGHSGVDFRILSAAAAKEGVPVLAAADGTIKGVRDGVPDIFLRDAGPNHAKGRECGNGVVVDHGDGWETQYCHLRSGSIRVKDGDLVGRGDRLGDVGYSGYTDFAHVQLIVRHNGSVVDPFAMDRPPERCGVTELAGPRTLWDAVAEQAFPYRAGEIIQSGFAAHIPDWTELERDHEIGDTPTSMSRRLVFFARILNVRAGDEVRISIRGPDGLVLHQTSAPLARNRAIYVARGARRLQGERWPTGRYDGEAHLLRDGKVIGEIRSSFELN